MRHRKRPGLHHIALAITTTIILAACGSSSGNTITPLKTTPTTAGTPTTTTSVAPTTSSSTALTGDAAIFAADQVEAANYFAVATENPINVADPRIATLAAGKQLVNERAALNLLSFHHQHDVGTYKGSQFRVEERSATSVLVLSCDLDMTAVVDNVTGQVVTPATNTSALINTRLDLIKGQWMVTDSGQRRPTC